ncbi:MAG: helix-turn-helix domain-containing protein [Bacteroidales bacterium]|nr:helix-turn-helix domain-containing protein [Bacteroidales bacterium]
MDSLENLDLYGKSNHDVIADLGRKFKAYRVALRLTQREVAWSAGISVITLVRFESGRSSSISLSNYVALLRTIQCLDRICDSVPDLPGSLYGKPSASQRVRRLKDEK